MDLNGVKRFSTPQKHPTDPLKIRRQDSLIWVLVFKAIKCGTIYNSEREKAEHFFKFIFCYCREGRIIPFTNWFHVF